MHILVFVRCLLNGDDDSYYYVFLLISPALWIRGTLTVPMEGQRPSKSVWMFGPWPRHSEQSKWVARAVMNKDRSTTGGPTFGQETGRRIKVADLQISCMGPLGWVRKFGRPRAYKTRGKKILNMTKDLFSAVNSNWTSWPGFLFSAGGRRNLAGLYKE